MCCKAEQNPDLCTRQPAKEGGGGDAAQLRQPPTSLPLVIASRLPMPRYFFTRAPFTVM